MTGECPGIDTHDKRTNIEEGSCERCRHRKEVCYNVRVQGFAKKAVAGGYIEKFERELGYKRVRNVWVKTKRRRSQVRVISLFCT